MTATKSSTPISQTSPDDRYLQFPKLKIRGGTHNAKPRRACLPYGTMPPVGEYDPDTLPRFATWQSIERALGFNQGRVMRSAIEVERYNSDVAKNPAVPREKGLVVSQKSWNKILDELLLSQELAEQGAA